MSLEAAVGLKAGKRCRIWLTAGLDVKQYLAVDEAQTEASIAELILQISYYVNSREL